MAIKLSNKAKSIKSNILNYKVNNGFWIQLNKQIDQLNLNQGAPIPIILNDKLYTKTLKIKGSTRITIVPSINPIKEDGWYDIKFNKMLSRVTLKEGNEEGKSSSRISDAELFQLKLSITKELHQTYFIEGLKLEFNSEKLKEYTEKYKIPKVTIKRDVDANTIEIETGLYILAKKYPDEFIECCKLAGDPEHNIPSGNFTKEAIDLILYNRKLQGYSLYSEFYIHRLRASRGFETLQAIKKGLTDIIPIAIKFPGKDNILYDKLLDKSTQIIPNDYVTQEDFEEFQNSLFELEAPAFFNRYNGANNTILFACKMDMEKLCGIRFNSHSLELSNLVLTSLLFDIIANDAPIMSKKFMNKLELICKNLGFILNNIGE